METIPFGITKALHTVTDVVLSILCIVVIILGMAMRRVLFAAFFIVPIAGALGLAYLMIHVSEDQVNSQWTTQCSADYRAVTSMHFSKLKQGAVIDLSRYQVDLNSNNATVVKILANGSVWAASTGTATVLVTNEANRNIHETIPITVN